VVEVIAKCCDSKYFKNEKYFFKKETVSEGCVLFRQDHEEALEKLFVERNDT